MALKIERGITPQAGRNVLYGTEGIGKSTLAAQWPSPLILDTEDGTSRIDCARVRCPDWPALYAALIDLTGDPQGFATVVIDSIDWAERHILEAMLRKDNKKSIEDYGFGKGYTKLAEQFGTLLGLCDQLVGKGVHVVLVGHSTVKRTTPPDMDEGWDRYELKLTKQTGPIVKEWSDALLFANYRTKLVEGTDGRVRAKGGKERVVYTERSAAFDAKNRYGLAPELPMTIDALAPLFAGVAPQPAAPAVDLVTLIEREISKASTVKKLGQIGERMEAAVGDGRLGEEAHAELLGLLNERHQEIAPEQFEAASVNDHGFGR
jgi:hypothetical protein